MAAVALTAALLVSPVTDPAASAAATPESQQAAPWHGLVGPYRDSNVSRVWRGATHEERSTWLCIRWHESRSYRGKNPTSSASGAGQWIKSTWDGLKVWVKVDGQFVARQYQEARHAPAWVQDAAFRHVYARGGLHMWRGTHCPGTD